VGADFFDSDSFFANEMESDAERLGDIGVNCAIVVAQERNGDRLDSFSRQDLTKSSRGASSPAMRRFGNTRLARMSSGHYCVIRDLGLVKGGKGLRHHEVVLDLSPRGLWRGAFKFAKSVLRPQAEWAEVSAPESASEPVLATQTTRRSRG
jgi:hypothetical protein